MISDLCEVRELERNSHGVALADLLSIWNSVWEVLADAAGNVFLGPDWQGPFASKAQTHNTLAVASLSHLCTLLEGASNRVLELQ
jgi:hypothetical protein